MDTELIVIIALGGLLFIFAVWILISRCCCRTNGYDEIRTEVASNTGGSRAVFVSQEQIEADRQKLAAEQAARSLQHNRLVTNFCRASSSQRDLLALHDVHPLGHRPIKFFAAIRDETVSASLPHRSGLLLTVFTIDVGVFSIGSRDARLLNLVNTPKAASVFKKALTKLQHPYLAPSIEVAVKLLPESLHVFVLRPFFPKGSLRDLLFSATPTASYTEKYLNKRGSPLKISQIAKIGRQVLEACCYMSDNGVPLYHLHAGNVLLDPNGDVRLSDYENALLGCISKYHKKMQSACSAYVSSDIVSFGYLLLEMATGQPIRRAVPDPAVFQALPLDLQVLVPTLQKIFPASKKQAKANGTLSWHKLRDDPLFAGAMSQSVAVEPFQFDERTSQALAATRMFFDEVYSPDAADSTPSAESDKKKTKKKKSKSSKSSSAVVQIDEDDEVDSHAISMTATTTTTTVTDSPRQPSKRPSLLGGVASDRTQTAKFKVTSSDAAIRAVLGDDASRMGDESDEDDEDDDDFIFGKPNASVDDLFGARRPTSMFAPKKGGDMWKDMDDE